MCRRLIRCAFQLLYNTGQRKPAVEAEPDVFERLNLTARVETEMVGGSTVTIVVAEKITPDNTVAAAPD